MKYLSGRIDFHVLQFACSLYHRVSYYPENAFVVAGSHVSLVTALAGVIFPGVLNLLCITYIIYLFAFVLSYTVCMYTTVRMYSFIPVIPGKSSDNIDDCSFDLLLTCSVAKNLVLKMNIFGLSS